MYGESSELSSSQSESSGVDSEDLSEGWIEWFLAQKGNEAFVEIDEDYIQDGFNMTGFAQMVPEYDQALAMILDEELSDDYDGQSADVEEFAKILYGLVHARFILTQKGMSLMMEKFNKNVYGSCPDIACEGFRCMPIATTDVHGLDGGKLYCPRCKEIFVPRHSRLAQVDGSFFGTSFAPFFFLVNSHLVPVDPPRPYVPRIYGFRVNPSVRVFGRAKKKALEDEERERRLASPPKHNGAQQNFGPTPAS